VAFSFFRILSYLLGLVGFLMLLPVVVAMRYGEEPFIPAFLVPALIGLAAAAYFRLSSGKKKRFFNAADAVVTVGGIWVGVSLFGAIPLYFSGVFASFADALFESVSGFTTTGASIAPDVESLPRCVNFWRCQMHWMGGMGVIALAVAIMPFMGDGGYSMVKAESSGPEKEKITAFVASTAKSLWLIYVIMTAINAALLRMAGLSLFDSLAHAFSTMASGGFSTRNESIGAFNNPAVEWISAVFMFLSAVNFVLYFRLISGRAIDIWRNTEFKAFVLIVSISAILIYLFSPGSSVSLRSAFFHVTSIISTTGFMTQDYLQWAPAAQMILLVLFFVGGCSGSTAGGVKVVRWIFLIKQMILDIRRIVHPYRVFTMRIDAMSAREKFVPVAAGFVTCYFALIFLTALFGALSGLDLFTAFTAGASMVGNVGPAFGKLGPACNYSFLSAPLKWWYSFAMLAGRLEIYTILILCARMLFPGRRGDSHRVA
jgi:trk system potassium uptake protein TrkH